MQCRQKQKLLVYASHNFFILNLFNLVKVEEITKKFRFSMRILGNKLAQEFWRKVVNNASNGNYEEHLIRDNTRYAFYFEN